MGVFPETSITYEGEKKEFRPDMRFMYRLEADLGEYGTSISGLVRAAHKGAPQMPLMALLVTRVLSGAGFEAVEDEIYRDMICNEEGAAELYYRCLLAISPEPRTKKKDDPKAKTKSKT